MRSLLALSLAAIPSLPANSNPALLAGPQEAAAAALRPWTFLVYGGADNNADGPILEFLDTVRKSLDDDPGVELVLWLDRSDKFSDDATFFGEDFVGTRLYRLRKDSVERLSGGEQFPEITLERDAEFDSSDADNLRRFIDWGKANWPAQRTGLMIYSHADGRTMCPDEESGGDMGIPELSRALSEKESLDFLALELCNMGGIEIGYEWRPAPGRFGADVLIGIPNAGPPLDWDRAFARIRSRGHAPASDSGPAIDPAQMTADDFGRLVIEEGKRGRELAMAARPERVAHEAAGAYDLRRAAAVKEALDALAVALDEDGDRAVFCEMRGPGPLGDAMMYTGSEGPYVDVFDLCQRAMDCDAFSDRVRERAQNVLKATDAFVLASFGMSAYPGFRDGKNGVFVVFPKDTPGRWRDFDWYTPLVHAVGGKDLGGWAFLADGAQPGDGRVDNWFELLDRWFDEDDGRGGLNGYRY